jgi:nicotinamide riboside transporter PnuC
MTPAVVETISFVATCIAVAGVVLNNYHMRWCFLLWLVSNAMSAAVHLDARLWSLFGRDCIFLVLAVHGWLKWSKR